MKKYKNYMGRNFKKNRSPEQLPTAKRSSLMAKICSQNTKFEEKFIAILKSAINQTFITHVRSLKGKPDIVFEKERICVFLDSDFWHGWQYPRWKHLLKNDFWRTKIEANRKRDIKTTRDLKKDGWKVIRVWEHTIIKSPEIAVERINQTLTQISKVGNSKQATFKTD